jgi:hypothetical protein
VFGSALRSRAGSLADYVRLLREEDEGAESLHAHDNGSHQSLEPSQKAAHERAKDASHLADHVAKNWPEKERSFLHGKASEEHTKTAQGLHAAGFSQLARQHLQWAHYHASHAMQHAGAPAKLVQHPASGGHPRSGHTLPSQPSTVQHYGDVPTASPSHSKAQRTDAHWNDQVGGYQEIPDSVKKLRKRANLVSKSVDRISSDSQFTDGERAHHHRAAAGNHVQAASELMRHGFHKQAMKHAQMAQKHTAKAADHDAVPRALPPGPEKESE